MWFYYSISPQSRRSTSKVSSKPLSLLMAMVEPRQLNDALEHSLSMTGLTGAPANGGQHSRSVKDLGVYGYRLNLVSSTTAELVRSTPSKLPISSSKWLNCSVLCA